MKNEARLFKSLADETRLKILWLLMGQDELCVCDNYAHPGNYPIQGLPHLRYLFNAGLVTDRREGVWINYSIAVPPGSNGQKFIQLVGEMLAATPEAQSLRQKLANWLKSKAMNGLCLLTCQKNAPY
jgi:ArsR family transcriptional regulator